MERLAPRERFATGLWLVIALVVWNGLYDLLLTRGAKEVLFRAALYEGGHGPEHSMAQIMAVTVRDAVWVCTFWASVILLAGMLTIRMTRYGVGRGRPGGNGGHSHTPQPFSAETAENAE